MTPEVGGGELDALLGAVLARAVRGRGVRYAEVRYVAERAERLRVRDGRPELVATGSTRGIGVRVLGARAWGFACSASLDEASCVAAADRAARVAEASSALAREQVLFPERGPERGSYATRVAIDPFLVPLEDKLAALDRPVARLLARGKPVTSAEAWMDWTRVDKRLVTSEGTDVTQSFTYGACGMHVIAVGDDGRAQRRSYPTWQGGDGFQGGYERVRELHLEANADAIVDEVVALLDAPPCPEGARALLLTSDQVALQIHESCGHPAELDRALGEEISLAGGSFLQPSHLGKLRYGSPIVSLYADALAQGGMGTFGWDDEGTRAGKRALVHDGVFVDYLSSRETAAALGRQSTGALRAEGWNRLPIIRMVNVSLDPRGGALDDLVRDTKDGVLMSTDKSWSIDDLRLNFQFSCELAWEIKGGKKTRLLRDPFYTGTTPAFWRSCDAICGADEWRLWGISSCGKGNPMQLMPVGHGASPARFREVRIGSSEGAR